MSTAKHLKTRGFSLVEILVTIVIGAVLMGIVSTSFPLLKRAADKFLNQAVFQEQYLIFLLKLEDEYHQAAIYSPDNAAQIDQLIFEQDGNLDGDLSDSGERITYRWNSKKQRIDRKSGNGNFQALLEGVIDFSWETISQSPVCHQLKVQDIFSTKPRTVVYCMDEL
ncbi:MAG: prepilin-type N-terminal cleavage/methylation domain-containing protein [Deltaproteobacteria bacterium]|jgi:prepilin-type N-terminal cleavage/methylation domain-containing protein|nr:prepilin-type N-terminal cleavage/methylation domain-containing protein [Deltaproteobacteria bacterium]MBT4267051.1 prepilin-type N-terminal cleavage/methylation domain-containing protein [Deltaproteobacteria bacterium]MBT4637525.1 prepilin-type N-terminal cleavage/methylation domain-containing protein [Deltaproteobacteria bacterium]MBT6504376.1 prepilin-type N-terminal cleavage/methylation domain-containing protein [Deltaproteobacteria bacterium]MBT7152706.1 prepilin-type N-terminal cleavag